MPSTTETSLSVVLQLQSDSLYILRIPCLMCVKLCSHLLGQVRGSGSWGLSSSANAQYYPLSLVEIANDLCQILTILQGVALVHPSSKVYLQGRTSIMESTLKPLHSTMLISL